MLNDEIEKKILKTNIKRTKNNPCKPSKSVIVVIRLGLTV
jgi:hypothetical protein